MGVGADHIVAGSKSSGSPFSGDVVVSAPTSLNDDLLNDGRSTESIMSQSTRRSRMFLFHCLWDEHTKDLVPESSEKKFRKTCPKEFGTSNEKWCIGDLLIELICYWTVRTVTTKWDLRTSETSVIF